MLSIPNPLVPVTWFPCPTLVILFVDTQVGSHVAFSEGEALIQGFVDRICRKPEVVTPCAWVYVPPKGHFKMVPLCCLMDPSGRPL
ncbi:uncharacterized protein EI90DRAFT_100930 [Cantharellus anzutake]|uniref:uncharacterized protein n=1 Tax=Cantharellus anzutake TaxID=1750568 RepID=UPI001907E66B|nr:uncharacterized protein EI90DRAFT_100930 [Cantharellus anzutake]KAF8337024.1 hypothetical protein EI90DRAFT_100930 [Cantharellus anzutake]